MNETQKTGIVAAITAVVIVLAIATRPVTVTKQDEKGGLAVGDLLFKEDAIDISKAASLKITKFDENKLSMESFEVVKDKTSGLWKIPSEYDYPADAEEQLKNATAPLTDLRILNIIEDAGRDDQTLYGVVEPSEKLEAGVTGVGMLVSVGDASGKNMASLIIGKQVDKAQENLHYVRVPNQDPVYTVDVDPAVFDTDFKKWIKPDLLQVKSFDITGVGIRDYQIERTQSGGELGAVMSKAMEADLSYDSASSKWKADRLVTYEGSEAKPVELGEGEELKSEKLNALRTAAQSLQIVGVRPKPKGLAADLKADKTLLGSDESMLSLFQQGFIPQAIGDATEIFAVAGETLLTTQDGVRYTLRFGEESVASGALESDAADEEGKPAQAGDKRERYLLVTATLDEGRFPAPDLQVVPQTIEELKQLDAEKAAAEAKKSEAAVQPTNDPAALPAAPQPAATDEPTSDAPKPEAPADAAQPTDAQPEESSPEAPSTEEAKAGESPPEPSADPAGGEDSSAEEKSGEDNNCGPIIEPQDETDAQAPEEPAEGKPAEDEPAEEKAAEEKAADQPAAKAAETDEELKDRLSVVQGDITKSNQRLLDARNEKMNAARKKVQELNARFADWYYLIEESSFKQLMLKKDELIGPKSSSPAPGAPGPGGPGAVPSFPGLPPLGEQ